MKLESFKETYFPQLADDYIHRFHMIQSRFDESPRQEKAFAARAAWLDKTEAERADRQQIAKIMQAYNIRIHNSRRAHEHIKQFADDRALVVVGGQQAGLFTGPLLVIYKAISVIQQAKKIAAKLDRPVIPIFWIAGEDHDLDEVDHLYLQDPDWQIQKLQLGRSTTSFNRLPISEYQIDEGTWTQAINQLEPLLRDRSASPDVLHKLRTMSTRSATLTDSFAQQLAWLFADYGLVLLDSADRHLRRLEAPKMSWFVQHADALNLQFMRGAERLTRLGYDVQAPPANGQANLFYVDERGRSLLHKQRDQFVTQSGLTWSMDELRTLAIEQPQQLSNNVLTRPLMQEYVLPTVGTVVGGSELAYWAQLKEAFHYAHMKLPIVLLRNRYTLFEGTLHKWLRKFDWSIHDVCQRWTVKRQEWLDAQDELNLHEQFQLAKQTFFEQYDPLLTNVAAKYPGLMKMTNKNKQKIERQISFLQKRVNDAYEEHHKVSLQKMKRLYDALRPLDQPQERVYNIVAYLNKYGIDWLYRLTEKSVVDHPECHHIVYL